MEILYFEDIEVGKKRTASLTYLVEKEEIVKFARHWDPRLFHVDEAASVSSVFGGIVACSEHIFSIVSWFATHNKQRVESMAALGFDELRIHHPVRPGDRLSCSFTCLEKRKSRTKQDRGIVRTLASLFNQHGTEVFSVIITTMVAKGS